jgi:tRNA dimethylallyltransferase
LQGVDPASAVRIEVHDQKRVLRALEVHALTGVTMAEHRSRHDHRRVAPRYPARFVGLAPARDILYQRINARVDTMMAEGFVDEVRGLRERGVSQGFRSQGAIGYAELHADLDGVLPLVEAVERIKRNSRRYARRQVSWYRSDGEVQWFEDPDRVDLDDLGRYFMRAAQA